VTSARAVCLLTTGGTIAAVGGAGSGASRVGVSGQSLLDISGSPEGVSVHNKEVFSIPSWWMGPFEMLQVANEAREAARGRDGCGVVISHRRGYPSKCGDH